MKLINNKRGEWYGRDWMISLLIFSAIIALYAVISADMANEYNRPEIIDSQFSSKYDRFSNNTARINTMLSSISSTSSLNPLDYGQLVLQGTFAVLSLFIASVGLFNSQMASMLSDFGIPTPIAAIVFPLILGIIIIMIVFIIVTSTSRNKI